MRANKASCEGRLGVIGCRTGAPATATSGLRSIHTMCQGDIAPPSHGEDIDEGLVVKLPARGLPTFRETVAFRTFASTRCARPMAATSETILHTRGDLVALTNGAHSNGVHLGSFTNGRRINWRSTFRAERLWSLVPAFAGFDVDFQFARAQFERVFPSVCDDAKRGSR
jgi:hypothetical protein